MGRLGSVLRGVLFAIVGLIVDDGLVVLGAFFALLATWALANAAPELPPVLIGIVLFGLVAASLIASLLRAARAAHRHPVEPPTGDRA
jgi:hypothetical protein